MVSGINTSSVAVSGNLSVLKKALDTNEQLMSSLISNMQGASSNLQSPQQAPKAPSTPAPSNGGLDIMA
ncbi:hypothetical protein B6S12_00625 [Helicobacter valdiviensis]|uniref:Motility protein n=1 Tax=Helicobacter valdiviensis TaxID=1458358 RepID=A0A2W6NJK5_9HELI|nr:hypothetical protein [Helicobacter valdiviensis]PZT49130.1 hypothetical protein B6S12_00625 [Helicobacter valdiviensis]